VFICDIYIKNFCIGKLSPFYLVYNFGYYKRGSGARSRGLGRVAKWVMGGTRRACWKRWVAESWPAGMPGSQAVNGPGHGMIGFLG
jgi:hypothetical protein